MNTTYPLWLGRIKYYDERFCEWIPSVCAYCGQVIHWAANPGCWFESNPFRCFYMVNNRHLVEPLLVFPNEDCFYFIQILQRKKDHKGEKSLSGGPNNNSRLIKAYYIQSLEQLDKQWDEMIKLATLFEARVSINLNPRNFKKAAFHTLQKIADQMSNSVFNQVHKAYNHVLGQYHNELDKRWIVDIDTQDGRVIEDIGAFIETHLHAEIKNKAYSILSLIPSKSGMHIITNPFNLERFHKLYPDIEVHKNNPTNLYIP